MSITQRELNHEAKGMHLATPTSDSGRVTMIVLGDCWVAEVSCNNFGAKIL